MMGVFAVVFGLLAVFVARSWLSSQADLRAHNPEPIMQRTPSRTVVVATAPLRFGAPLAPDALREVVWPENAVPAGTFASIKEVIGDGKRMVLASIEPNEPILASKVTGPGQRATLSAVIQPGMRAVTVRVNDVEGVAGFVLPGDHVDILLTRHQEKEASTTDVVLQHVRVLAIDQIADDSTDKPAIVKAVTLEVDSVAAQKVALAASIGSLALALRKAGEAEVAASRRVTLGDLVNGDAGPKAREPKRFATVTVTRASKSQEYSVPTEDKNWLEASEAARGDAR